MKSKITIAAVTLASLLGSLPEVRSQQPFTGYVSDPRGQAAYGAVAPTQFTPVVPAPADVAPSVMQPVPPTGPQPIPQAADTSAPVVSPSRIGEPTAWQQGVWSAGTAGNGAGVCDAYSACDQCGSVAGDCACDAAWGGDSCLDRTSGLWARLSSLGQCGLLSGCGSECGYGCAYGCGFGLCNHPRLAGLWSRLGLCHAGYPRPTWIWGEGEYLLWWSKNRAVPVLATTSVDGTPFSEAGVLGAPGTSVLFGGGKIDNAAESGYRFGLGLWLDPYQTWGIGGRYFRLGPDDTGYDGQSDGSTILARPFYNISIGQEDSLVVAYPGESSGSVFAENSNDIWGYDVYLRRLLYYGNCNRVDLIMGYQNTQLDDTVSAGHRLVTLRGDNVIPVGTVVASEDRFEAENEFHGGELGLMAQCYDGRLTWNLLTKIAAGNMRESMTIRGQTMTTIPGDGSSSSNQGLLALNTNSGVYEDDEFCIVPEASLSMAYSVTNLLQVSVGYSLIYWSNVALAGDAIDDVINPTQIGGQLIGPARPAYAGLSDDSYWVQGLTFGVGGRF